MPLGLAPKSRTRHLLLNGPLGFQLPSLSNLAASSNNAPIAPFYFAMSNFWIPTIRMNRTATRPVRFHSKLRVYAIWNTLSRNPFYPRTTKPTLTRMRVRKEPKNWAREQKRYDRAAFHTPPRESNTILNEGHTSLQNPLTL